MAVYRIRFFFLFDNVFASFPEIRKNTAFRPNQVLLCPIPGIFSLTTSLLHLTSRCLRIKNNTHA